jgi:ubiquinone/menaquinone biosynthesis C-methylase UbiE
MSAQSLRQRLISQFHRPRGVVGRAVGWFMAHRGSNRQRNIWVVGLLDLQATDRVLEVGFGPGIAIAEVARRVTQGRVYGIDHSEVMVRQATRRNAAAVRAGRVELLHAPVDRLPTFDTSFDVILAVNSLGFWPDPAQRLSELRDLLRPGGRIVLVSQPRCAGANAGTTERAGRELRDRLTTAGLTDIRVETLDLDPPVACVIAR